MRALAEEVQSFLMRCNKVRPHESLGQRPPARDALRGLTPVSGPGSPRSLAQGNQCVGSPVFPLQPLYSMTLRLLQVGPFHVQLVKVLLMQLPRPPLQ